MSDERLLVVPYVPVMVLLGFSIIAAITFLDNLELAGLLYLIAGLYRWRPSSCSCQKAAALDDGTEYHALWLYIFLFHWFAVL